MANDTLFHGLFWGLLGGLMLVRVLSIAQVRRSGSRFIPNKDAIEREGWTAFAIRFVGFFVLIGILVAYALDPRWMRAIELPIQGTARWAGFVIGLLGVAIVGWAQVTIGRQWSAQLQLTHGHQLVTGGPYAYIRHPIYAALIAISIGFALVTANWLFIGFGGLAITMAIDRIPRGEDDEGGCAGVWRVRSQGSVPAGSGYLVRQSPFCLTTRWSRPGQLRQNEFKILSKRWPGGSSRGRWAASEAPFDEAIACAEGTPILNIYDHTAFQVSQMDQAIDFYVKKLGFTLLSRAVNAQEQEAYAFLALADLRLELIQDLSHATYSKPTIRPPDRPHLAIQTDDMALTVARLKQTGVAILRGPLEVKGEDTWVYFCDPDNNILEYVQWYGDGQGGQ